MNNCLIDSLRRMAVLIYTHVEIEFLGLPIINILEAAVYQFWFYRTSGNYIFVHVNVAVLEYNMIVP